MQRENKTNQNSKSTKGRSDSDSVPGLIGAKALAGFFNAVYVSVLIKTQSNRTHDVFSGVCRQLLKCEATNPSRECQMRKQMPEERPGGQLR